MEGRGRFVCPWTPPSVGAVQLDELDILPLAMDQRQAIQATVQLPLTKTLVSEHQT